MPKVPVKFGSMEDQYFTQWRIDELSELLDIIVYCYGDDALVDLQDAIIYYDSVNDYHILEFVSNNRKFVIRLYKAYSYSIDGVDCWTGCPQYMAGEFAKSIRDWIRLL